MSDKKLVQVRIALKYGANYLPVIHCEDGHDRIPLKPIVDEIGIKWETQRIKVQPDKELGARLGSLICVVDWSAIQVKTGNPRYLCIRIDRVAAFLSAINPVQVRAQKNISSAEWLEFWRKDWDAVLDAYESHPMHRARIKNETKLRKQLASIVRLKKQTKNINDRDLLDRIFISVTEETGVSLPAGTLQ